MTGTENIGIIIIWYNPSEEDIQSVSAIASIYKGAVVDNSSCRNIADSQIGRMTYLPLMENKGIAEAQNVGVKELLKDPSMDFVVFLDQDSRLAADYPMKIAREYLRICQIKYHLAILGPTVNNIQTGETYHSVIHKDAAPEEGFIERREVISSGSVVPILIFEDIGFNDASLFIDYVDFELCWRALKKGYCCGITENVQINHQVGSRELSFGSYKVIISAPVRYYYQYRNHLRLCFRGYVPLQWKINNAVKHVARLIYFPFLVRGGWKCWLYMWKGIAASIKR